VGVKSMRSKMREGGAELLPDETKIVVVFTLRGAG